VDEYLLSEEDASEDGLTRAEEVDGFIAHAEGIQFFSYVFFVAKNAHIFCQALLDEKGGCLSEAERKARKRLFQAVQNGDFSDLEDIGPASKYIPHLCLIKLSPYKYQDARG